MFLCSGTFSAFILLGFLSKIRSNVSTFVNDNVDALVERMINERINLKIFRYLSEDTQISVIDSIVELRESEILVIELCPDFKIPKSFKRFSSIEEFNVRLRLNNPLYLYKYGGKLYFDDLQSNHDVNRAIKELNPLCSISCLELINLGLTEIPPEIISIKTLKTLIISHSSIYEIPKEFSELTNMINLTINKSELHNFPEVVFDLKLEYLNFDQNHIKEIPSSIGKMISLKNFTCSSNKLHTLPAEINKLIDIEHLEFDHNNLVSLSLNLFKLAKLISLDVSYNLNLIKISLKVPPKPTSFKALDAFSCSLSEFDPNISLLNLSNLNVQNNPLRNIGSGDKVGYQELLMIFTDEVVDFRSTMMYELPNISNAPDGAIHILKTGSIHWNFDIIKKLKAELNLKMNDSEKLFNLWKELTEITYNIHHEEHSYLNAQSYLNDLCGKEQPLQENWEYFMYDQYKDNIQNILISLFSKLLQLENHNEILTNLNLISKVFLMPQSAQVISFYVLLKRTENDSHQSDYVENFIKDSIAILKDYIFTMSINFRGSDHQLLKYWRARLENKLGLQSEWNAADLKFGKFFFNDYPQLIEYIFYSKFNIEYYCQTLTCVINGLNGKILDRFIEFILHFIDGTQEEYFEYEKVAGVMIPIKIKERAIEAILLHMNVIINSCN